MNKNLVGHTLSCFYNHMKEWFYYKFSRMLYTFYCIILLSHSLIISKLNLQVWFTYVMIHHGGTLWIQSFAFVTDHIGLSSVISKNISISHKVIQWMLLYNNGKLFRKWGLINKLFLVCIKLVLFGKFHKFLMALNAPKTESESICVSLKFKQNSNWDQK